LQTHWTIVYTGQIYDADGVMSFREAMGSKVRLEVGGQVVLDDDAWDSTTTGAIDFGGGGWFDFEVRFASGGTASGMQADRIGFEWDRDGGTKWRRPKNPDADTAALFRTPAG
jgi:hypothetical protein